MDYIRRGATNFHRDLAISRIGDMGYLGTNATIAVPLLLELARSDPASARAILSLGELRLDAERVVPVLVEKARSTNATERYAALESLGDFGPQAGVAIPHLQPLLVYDDMNTRRYATNALHAIMPGAFTNTAATDHYE